MFFDELHMLKWQAPKLCCGEEAMSIAVSH
jgi:hypothetical protein